MGDDSLAAVTAGEPHVEQVLAQLLDRLTDEADLAALRGQAATLRASTQKSAQAAQQRLNALVNERAAALARAAAARQIDGGELLGVVQRRGQLEALAGGYDAGDQLRR